MSLCLFGSSKSGSSPGSELLGTLAFSASECQRCSCVARMVRATPRCLDSLTPMPGTATRKNMNDAQLTQAREAVLALERSLAILKRDHAHIHPDRYALMAAPILEDLQKLRQSIDEYVGVDVGRS